MLTNIKQNCSVKQFDGNLGKIRIKQNFCTKFMYFFSTTN